MKKLVKSAIKKSFNTVGLDIRRKIHEAESVELVEGNLVVPSNWNQPVFSDMIPFRIQPRNRPVVILGSATEIDFLRTGFINQGWNDVKGIEWNWEQGNEFSDVPEEAQVIVCKLPMNEQQWRIINDLKDRYGNRVIGIQELVLPFTAIQQARSALVYAVNSLPE